MLCNVCKKEFIWQDEDLKNFQKFGFEPFESCANCLHMQRLAFRNERVFYRRKCDATGEEILSVYRPEAVHPVYKADYFWSDQWDARNFGLDFDFSRPFFEQLRDLRSRVPRLAILNFKAENSDFCNSTAGNKNCYMIFGGDFNEDCMFGVLCDKNRFCSDLDYSYNCELCYFSADIINCYDCQFVFDSENCANSYFCSDCTGCNECILCFNQKNKSYYIENQRYEREQYFKLKEQLITGKSTVNQQLLKKFLEQKNHKISKYAHILNCQNCSGDYLKNSKNCSLCFDVSSSEDCRDVIYASKVKDCFLCDMLGQNSELCFNTVSTAGAYGVRFSWGTVDCANLDYCDFCYNSKNLFGCVSMNQARFCILNKQYSEEEYREMLPKIVQHLKETGEWGRFMPAELSYFGYNETTAQLYFPLEKDQAIERGYNWVEEIPRPVIEQTYQIPDDIAEVQDNILKEALQCANCQKNFRILSKELNWYRDHKVPIPRTCFDCRMRRRAKMRNPRKLWKRECMKCGKEVQSSYAPERLEVIYCEDCYLAQVY